MKNHGAFFYLILLLALAAVTSLVYLLAPGSEPDTPPVLLPAPTVTDTAPDDSETPDAYIPLEVTPETVQTVIATLRRIDSYSRTLDVRDFWSGGGRGRSIQVWAHAGALRISAQSENSGVQEHLLLRGDEKWIWYSDDDRVYAGPAAQDDADAYQTILTYEKVLTLPGEDILDAGYTDYDGRYCIFVRCRMGSLGYVSECYIDPDTGLLMGERCYDGETLIYSMNSTVPDVSTPDDALFTVPGISKEQQSADGK